MRSLALTFVDTCVFVLVTVMAFYLRTPEEKFLLGEILANPYVGVGAAALFLGLQAAGIGRELWGLSSYRVYWRIAVVTAIAILVAMASTFTFTRLDGVPRSIPAMQFLFGATALIGARKLAQHLSGLRQAGAFATSVLPREGAAKSDSVLIVGVNSLSGMILHLIQTYASGRLDVVGFVTTSRKQVGRTAFGLRILGHVEDLAEVTRELQTHGVDVSRLVLAAPENGLPVAARSFLAKARAAGSTQVMELPDVIAAATEDRAGSAHLFAMPEGEAQRPRILVDRSDLAAITRRRYWFLKRAIDVGVSASALVLAAPVMVMVVALVAARMGTPVLFWQRRPGLGGRPFHVLKFRTMRPAVDVNGRRLSDAERTCAVGDFLRRTRLDELPQLINVLRGEMSLIGPRPLLPRDQSDAHAARLIVRPGLTGWAQIVGGRTISADDKAALDIWYVYNASLWLDLRIALRTIPMVLFGEKYDQGRVDWALAQLRQQHAKFLAKNN
ncbi:sugar transferase [Bosea sp. (in: a-proteobacteria)]|uniref:sugar transferase n=1 Tax=Bosea sp. (in: a-proteobacteria) TaxID=1871050 RepID=UPI0026024554|nr:sugar transferase [Bosea sp. (in: a-proteobacteria)]MCO5091038.1 sugar transferase [Bosea sp. (in: a-proteobacteria)]